MKEQNNICETLQQNTALNSEPDNRNTDTQTPFFHVYYYLLSYYYYAITEYCCLLSRNINVGLLPDAETYSLKKLVRTQPQESLRTLGVKRNLTWTVTTTTPLTAAHLWKRHLNNLKSISTQPKRFSKGYKGSKYRERRYKTKSIKQ